MVAAIRELLDHKLLLYLMTLRQIRVKYKQSIMGVLWAVLMPLVIVSAGVIVRFAFATVSGKHLALLDHFTGRAEIYSGFDTQLFAGVTYQTWAFREARVRRLALFRFMTTTEIDSNKVQDRLGLLL